MNLFFPPDFHFKHPYIFFLVLLLIPIGYSFYRSMLYKKRLDVTFYQRYFNLRNEVLNALFLLLAFGGLLFCLMQPEGYMQKEKAATEANLDIPLPLLFILDNTLSMNTPDASFKKPRMEEGKEIISALISELPTYPKAFFTFTDHLQPIIPLTVDDTFITLSLDALSPNISKEGTDILTSLKELKEQIDSDKVLKPRQIVFISDGDDTTIHPNIAAMERLVSELAAAGIQFHVIGVGSVQGAPIPDLTFEKKPVISHKNEKLLKALAKAGEGKYIDPSHISVLSLTEDLSHGFGENTYQKLYTSNPEVSYIPLFACFAILAVIALLRGF